MAAGRRPGGEDPTAPRADRDQGEREGPRSAESVHGGWERLHQYGPRVHILNNLHLLTLIARAGGSEVRQPELAQIVRTIYQALMVAVAGAELPRVEVAVPTRMSALHPEEGVYRGPLLDPGTRVVVVDVIRAGIVPSQTCYEMLNSVLPPEHVRLDHLNLARRSDESGRVVGVELSGSKIGGSVTGSVLLLPDPMGATGATTVKAVRHYLEHHGQPARIVAMPMIATPEYLAAVTRAFPELVVYTARLDRGLSAPDVLDSIPGTHWERERGLNDHGYIVPGAGGMGEVLNNAWC